MTTAILSFGSSAVTHDLISGRISTSTFAIGISVPISILLLGMCIVVILWTKRKKIKNSDEVLK